MIKDKIKIILLAVLGELYKICIKINIIKPKIVHTKRSHDIPKVVVSLTSYGRRVKKVHYTIISLLRQSCQPDMIILWLDVDHWNMNNLPNSLKRLTKYGLTIKFCKDLKSYKKLIPSLNNYPEDLIITCDDDIYYRSNMVQRLVEAYRNDPTKIYAHRAHEITFADGKLCSYNKWIEEVSDKSGKKIFPTSGGGTLYTKKHLYKDVCNEELFSTLCPNADDVWNYFMGFMQDTNNVVLPYKGYIYIPLDVFYQAFHKGSNLASVNCGESMNDVQIKAIMEHYGIRDQELM